MMMEEGKRRLRSGGLSQLGGRGHAACNESRPSPFAIGTRQESASHGICPPARNSRLWPPVQKYRKEKIKSINHCRKEKVNL